MTDPHAHPYTLDPEVDEKIKQESSQLQIEMLKSTISQLQEENTQLQEQLQQAADHRIRLQADHMNFIKRKDMEKDQAVKYAQFEFLREFIFVLDSLESGLLSTRQASQDNDSVIAGLDMIQNQVLQLLEKFEVHLVNPAIGSPYDSSVAEAMTVQPSTEYPNNSILMVVQRGYLAKGRILRPARVIVVKNEAIGS